MLDPARAAPMGILFSDTADWAEEFAVADRRVRVLATHVGDAPVKRLLGAYLDTANAIIDGDVTTDAEFRVAQAHLDTALDPFRNRAAIVIPALMKTGTPPGQEHGNGATAASIMEPQ